MGSLHGMAKLPADAPLTTRSAAALVVAPMLAAFGIVVVVGVTGGDLLAARDALAGAAAGAGVAKLGAGITKIIAPAATDHDPIVRVEFALDAFLWAAVGGAVIAQGAHTRPLTYVVAGVVFALAAVVLVRLGRRAHDAAEAAKRSRR